MIEHAFRLYKGQDLKVELERYCQRNSINACCILSACGCVFQMSIRLADGVSILNEEKHLEIVSCTGTISSGKAHIHISFSDIDGRVIGGHLKEGCLINTTCEICLAEFEDYLFSREFDNNTGYDELVVTKK